MFATAFVLWEKKEQGFPASQGPEQLVACHRRHTRVARVAVHHRPMVRSILFTGDCPQARQVHEKKAREKKSLGASAPGAASPGAADAASPGAAEACVDRARHTQSTLKKATGTAKYAVLPPIRPIRALALRVARPLPPAFCADGRAAALCDRRASIRSRRPSTSIWEGRAPTPCPAALLRLVGHTVCLRVAALTRGSTPACPRGGTLGPGDSQDGH
jgi:hypothetical protein